VVAVGRPLHAGAAAGGFHRCRVGPTGCGDTSTQGVGSAAIRGLTVWGLGRYGVGCVHGAILAAPDRWIRRNAHICGAGRLQPSVNKQEEELMELIRKSYQPDVLRDADGSSTIRSQYSLS
jgi:hypothetical protein